MSTKHRSSLVIAALCGVLFVATATVGAATIAGTPGNDTLRGGPSADKLYGKGGNDKLLGAAGNDVLVGGAGNDVLVGGPGADRLSCGAGRDRARGDAKDKVAKDCEVVSGVPAPEPPAPPAPPPPPPPPPAPKALAGTYCGNTVQGPPLCITTNSDATGLASIRTSSLVDCTQPVQLRFEFTIGFQGNLPIQSDLSFALNYSGPISSGSSDITNLQTTYFIRGVFTTDGKATGQLAVTALSFDYAGYHFACAQNPVDWSVTKQG
jgi:RTX calcium-binding nonapeptide repeat (4 copies)